ncbi:hypothetical protein [Mesorhizobium sp. ES1-1]|uniref:hypothetical protein n=1 Tax=Mesorhizobium sp. ES1-1 TaxID=2876629 RepID=UPI001CCAB8F9|nr:hypothetical protein [Mesorhizobium sp. ES1-1]MBZ9676950.1 hypothetical protein [Mesorhizobium sp. ES1-1]
MTYPVLYQWLAIPLLFSLDTLWISSIMGVPVSQLIVGEALVTLLVSFMVTGLWVAYVYRSVRVRNTFTDENASVRAVAAS